MNNNGSKMIDNNKHSFRFHEVLILVVITCFFSFFAGVSMERVHKANDNIDNKDMINISDELQSFISDYNYILDNYYEKLDEKELLDAALKGVLALLDDPYSMYIDSDDYSNMNILLNGSYYGIGISVAKVDDNMIVLQVFNNSPAAKADIQVGDIITKINDTLTSDLDVKDFSNMVIKGDVDKFNLVILRNEEEKTVTVKRENIVIDTVTSKMFEKNDKKIGYIDIDSFAANTGKQFSNNLAKLEKQKIDSLIIDVRSNTGGHLSVVGNILSQLMDSSYVIYQLEQDSKKNKVYSTGNNTKEYQIVVLGNSLSASAAEILIGSLKDNLKAFFIGNKTYGKGTVQELKNLPNGDQYKITTKKWLTPKGDWVNDSEGIIPDIEIELDDKYIANPTDDNDNQLQKALEFLTQ